MSDCTNGEMRDLLPELMHGRLDAETQRRVEAHVASCAQCADELAFLRSLQSALMRAPVVDTRRIAAAVRALTAGSQRRRHARDRMSTPWRIAIAAAALIALSTVGYAIATHRGARTQEVAVVNTTDSTTKDSATRARTPQPVPRRAPHVAIPRSSPVQAPPAQVAVAPPHVPAPRAAPTTLVNGGVLGNLSDLSDDDVRTLAASLGTLSSLPDADPSPGIDLLGTSLDVLSAGGS